MTGSLRALSGKAFLRAAVAGAMLAGGTIAASAPARAIELDVSIWHNESSAWTWGFEYWAREVKERTEGRVTLKPFYSGALTKANETFNAVRDGAVPVGTTSAASISGQVPPLAYVEAEAGMPNSIDGFVKVAGELRPVIDEMLAKHRIKYLWMLPSYGATVVCRDKHLGRAGDWKGLKIRTAGRWQVQQIRELGASPVAMDPAEQYLSLQNGTIDCALSNNEITLFAKLYEPAPKVTDLRVTVNVLLYLANMRTWNRIPEADRKLVAEATRAAEEATAKHLFELQRDLQEKYAAAGADLYRLSDAERKEFAGVMQSVFDKMDSETGADGKRVRKILEPYW